MKIKLLLAMFAIFRFANAQDTLPEKKVTVSGTVTQTLPYCGGARPSEEMIEKYREPFPYPGKKFHVIKGDTNTTSHKIILSFTTDTLGNFSFQLAPGTYSILLDEQATAPNVKKYKKQSIRRIDEACYYQWWAKSYYVLHVKNADVKDLKFVFHHRCFLSSDIPCLQYTGPMPP